MEYKNLCVRVANFANELKLWIFGNKKHQENPDVQGHNLVSSLLSRIKTLAKPVKIEQKQILMFSDLVQFCLVQNILSGTTDIVPYQNDLFFKYAILYNLSHRPSRVQIYETKI